MRVQSILHPVIRKTILVSQTGRKLSLAIRFSLDCHHSYFNPSFKFQKRTRLIKSWIKMKELTLLIIGSKKSEPLILKKGYPFTKLYFIAMHIMNYTKLTQLHQILIHPKAFPNSVVLFYLQQPGIPWAWTSYSWRFFWVHLRGDNFLLHLKGGRLLVPQRGDNSLFLLSVGNDYHFNVGSTIFC